jgi:hypothetical protein
MPKTVTRSHEQCKMDMLLKLLMVWLLPYEERKKHDKNYSKCTIAKQMIYIKYKVQTFKPIIQ